MDKLEDQTIYCRKLGQWLDFDYCRRENGEFPCRSIFDCWSDRMDVRRYLEEHRYGDKIEEIILSEKPKIVSIIESIEEARKRLKEIP